MVRSTRGAALRCRILRTVRRAMSTKPIRMLFQHMPIRGLVLTLALLMSPTQVLSQGLTTDSRLVRFVCQAYSAEEQKFLGRVLVLEQTSTNPLGTGVAETISVDGSMLIAEGHAVSVAHEAEFRLRIYDDVSLISHMGLLVGHDVQHMDIEQLEDAGRLDQADRIRYFDDVMRKSLSIGSTDEEVVAELRSREGSHSSAGQLMDYVGAVVRSGDRISFRPTGRYRTAKSMVIFLKVLRGFVDTAPRTSDSPEDGPYLCRKPVLVSGGLEIGSLCREGYQGQIDLYAIAEPRTLVRRIQQLLADHGFEPGLIDGIIGPRTLSALWAWKETKRYEPSGFLTYGQLCALLLDVAE